jgi:hypothetical protein
MEALGLADAKAMVIAINDAEKAMHLVALVHMLPQMVILSRAFDDRHPERAAGAHLTVPEPSSIGDTNGCLLQAWRRAQVRRMVAGAPAGSP